MNSLSFHSSIVTKKYSTLKCEHVFELEKLYVNLVLPLCNFIEIKSYSKKEKQIIEGDLCMGGQKQNYDQFIRPRIEMLYYSVEKMNRIESNSL